MSQLDIRSIRILTTIIEEYIASAAPVGSKWVAANSQLSLSSASMRNSMANLTELGYLEQPHTSSGRVPTNKAFRLYIDRLLDLRPLPLEEKNEILRALGQNDLEMSEVLRRATALVASRCNQVSMVLAPEPKAARWNSIGFAQSGPGKVLAIMLLQGGMVETRIISTSTKFSSDELTSFGNYLNSNFQGMTLASAREAIEEELTHAEAHLQKMMQQALTLGGQAVAHMTFDRELFVEGTRAILDQVEFSDISSAREMFAFLEERTRLLELLDATMNEAQTIQPSIHSSIQSSMQSPMQPEVQVNFWRAHALPGCSMVSAPYGNNRLGGGVVSVIGPSRMNYSAVMPVVSYISTALTNILQGRAVS